MEDADVNYAMLLNDIFVGLKKAYKRVVRRFPSYFTYER